ADPAGRSRPTRRNPREARTRGAARRRAASPRAVPTGTQDAGDRVGRDVAGDARVLLQSPKRVLVPVRSERHVDPQAMPLVDERVPEPRAHTEQHLELVPVTIEPALRDGPLRLLDQPFVVRRDPDVATGVEQRFEGVDEALLHRAVVAELDLARLDVDA